MVKIGLNVDDLGCYPQLLDGFTLGDKLLVLPLLLRFLIGGEGDFTMTIKSPFGELSFSNYIFSCLFIHLYYLITPSLR